MKYIEQVLVGLLILLSQEEQSNCASMCKSQPLFSPVHESYMPNTNLSVDSLDLSENDINLMVTCQGNKHNYTIAFEGSTVMGADDSESRETGNFFHLSFNTLMVPNFNTNIRPP